jgi:hypothetical protein
MNLPARLAKLFTRTPLAYAHFDLDRSENILESRHAVQRFTLTQPHGDGENLEAPALTLVQFHNDHGACSAYVGVLARKQAASTLDTRLTFWNLRELSTPSLVELGRMLPTKAQRTRFRAVRESGALVSALPPQLGLALMNMVLEKDEAIVEAALRDLPNYLPVEDVAWAQKDANKLAQSIFGLSGSDRLDDVASHPDRGSRLFEDRVVDHDASVVPGYQLISRHLTGRSEFHKDGEVLHVFNANRGPLEKALGVDLVYINDTLGNIVMVQYKMLEEPRPRDGNEWTFRPDRQLAAEMARMRLPKLKRTPTDYRLYRDPFFFKFVKRRLEQPMPQSFIVSLGHLERVLADPLLRGPRRGVRVSYASLGGSYLREADLIGLIRSGYVGTHAIETKKLRPFLDGFLRGNRALVLAWQTELERD